MRLAAYFEITVVSRTLGSGRNNFGRNASVGRSTDTTLISRSPFAALTGRLGSVARFKPVPSARATLGNKHKADTVPKKRTIATLKCLFQICDNVFNIFDTD